MSWLMVKLKDCCDVVGGATPKRNIASYWEGDIPWITPKDISNLNSPFIYEAPEYISSEGYKAAATYMLPVGTILLTSRAPIGNVAIAGIELCTNQGFKSLIPGKNVHNKYLYHCIKKFAPKLELLGNGATFKEVSKTVVENFEIPLPPFEEQIRIARILDKCDGIRQKREQAIKLADDYLRAKFLEMFGDPVENPKGWKKDKIKKGVLGIASGWSATGENIPCKSDEFGVLKISSVTSGVFKPEENKVVACESIPASKKLIHPKKGDLLFSRANTRELVAAICMVHQDYDNLFLPDKLWSIKLNHKLLLPEFFLILIQNEKVRELLTKQATGTSGSMLNISKNKFEETEIIFPEINVQKDFCNTFRKTINLKTKLIKSNELANESFNSLSQKVFQQ
ncbi:restriction endonuclease subunit S [Escherichia coli]|uniref:restriction endonuclease subunit S n=1 Tax=Escherichia coli TaxID=562 RepID=UPI000B7E194A|nr:restriction endonuclease subunit S [Escherichia coli]HAH9219087.1 restriction endonuclease subunit S [Escherichia coli]